MQINIPIKPQYLFTIFVFILSIAGCASTESPAPTLSFKLKQQAIKEELHSHLEEYQSVKPAIERLVALESDLRLLMDQIANLEPMPQQPANTDTIANSGVQESKPTQMITEPAPILPTLEETIQAAEQAKKAASKTKDLVEQIPQITVAQATEVTPVTEPEERPSNKPNASSGTVTQLRELQDKTNFVNVSSPLSTDNIRSLPRLFPSQLYTQCVPQPIQPDETQFGVHIASFKLSNKLPEGWNKIVKRYPELCKKGGVVRNVSINGTTFYSLRVGPYENKQAAKAFCSTLKANSQYCRITHFNGEAL